MNKKLDSLQIGRGLAALIVVLHHITGSSSFYFHDKPFGGIFTSGWNGVDFFFVLSGFIIYYIHQTDLAKPFKLKSYLIKRFIRIYPTYWIIATVGYFLLLISSKNITNNNLAQLLHNPSYIIKSFLLIKQDNAPFLGVAWSMCYEIFFYLIFGLCIVFGRWVLFLSAFIYSSLLINNIFSIFYISNPFLAFYSSPYNLEFIMGILAAYTFNLSEKRISKITLSSNLHPYLLLIGAFLFGLTWHLSAKSFIQKGSIESCVLYGLSSVLIIYSSSFIKLKSNNYIKSFFIYLGDSSYVLYLIHPIVLSIIFKTFSSQYTIIHSVIYMYSLSIFALALNILLAIAFHKQFELKLIALFKNLTFNRETINRK